MACAVSTTDGNCRPNDRFFRLRLGLDAYLGTFELVFSQRADAARVIALPTKYVRFSAFMVVDSSESVSGRP